MEWYDKAFIICDRAERVLAQYHARLHKDANDCLRMTRKLFAQEAVVQSTDHRKAKTIDRS